MANHNILNPPDGLFGNILNPNSGLLGAIQDPSFWRDVGVNANNLGWRGLLAETLGTPVDMATTVMRPFGYNQQAPVMGSDWIKNQLDRYGVTGGERQPMTEMLTSMIVPDAMDAARLTNALAPAMLGAIAYHGSPHKFSKFDMSKIGTGEGAQAYGHGLYFAENPNVAKEYADALGNKLNVGGQQMLAKNTGRTIGELPVGELGQREQTMLRDAWISSDYTPDGIIRQLDRNIAFYKTAKSRGVAEAAENLAAAQKVRDKLSVDRGSNLYKVDIPDQYVDNFLDWDNVWSKQPDSVHNAIKNLPKEVRDRISLVDKYGNESTGGQIYNQIQEYFAAGRKNDVFSNAASYGAKEASDELNYLGVKGIKYFDQGSRAAGKGTRNFVVFDDEIIKILGRE